MSLSRCVVPALVFSALGLGCGGDGEGEATNAALVPQAQEVVLSAAPQADHVFLSWSPVAGASHYRTQWKAADQSGWTEGATTATTNLAVPLPAAGTWRFRVLANRGEAELGRSDEVAAEPHSRQDCTYLAYMPWEPRASVFCSWAALRDHLQWLGIAPERLKCRDQPVLAWDASVPDCYYTVDGHQLLLLRGIGDRLVPPQVARPATVRSAARAAIWGAADPYSTHQIVPLQPAGVGDRGAVRKATSAIGFSVPPLVVPGVASRVTMLLPRSPQPGRFAIYHEGHGGAAVDIGAETIDWLLERGWVVFAMDMPLIGRNAVDVAPGHGLATHNDLLRFDDGRTSPLAAFLLPVKAVVDHIQGSVPAGQPPVVMMIGRSGGGWSTYAYSALDPRIDVAVSVAGGRPLSQRLDAPWGALELGDYEQTDPTLYSKVGHEHLMTAAGRRGGLLMFAANDPCCFRLRHGDPFVTFVDAAARANGTAHSVFIDNEHMGHGIGPNGYEALAAYLAATLGNEHSTGQRAADLARAPSQHP